MSPERRKRRLIAANWKMHLLRADALAWCRTMRRASQALPVRSVVFPSYPLIPAVVAELAESDIAVGSQDLHPEEKGAHTGDVSAAQIRDAGCTWALCGHSERRRDHGEGDALVAAKAAAAARHHLIPMLCIGETREERKAGATLEVLGRQLGALLAGPAAVPERFAVAYEPVWAIGTGETASPQVAAEAHAFIRQTLAESLGGERAEAISILYGGSCTPENAGGLITQPNIDGFLVGGASLDPEKFLGIITVCA
jgi:triosephosphate isomerase